MLVYFLTQPRRQKIRVFLISHIVYTNRPSVDAKPLNPKTASFWNRLKPLSTRIAGKYESGLKNVPIRVDGSSDSFEVCEKTNDSNFPYWPLIWIVGGILILIWWRYNLFVTFESKKWGFTILLPSSNFLWYCSISKFESSQDESNLYKNSVHKS